MKKSEENRLKCAVYESTRAPLCGPPSPMGKAAIRGYRFSRHNAFPKREGKEEAASPQKKEANPASLRSAAPSKGRGSRGHSLLPLEGGAPKGRRLDGAKRYEKERERSSQVRRLRKHPSAATRSPFPNGEGCDTRMSLFSTQRLSQGGKQRGGGFAAKKGSQPRLAALGSPFQGKGLAWTLPPSYGRRCPEGAEVGWGKRYEREGRLFQVRRWREHPIHRCAVPLPQWGRLRYEDTAFLASSKQIRIRGEKE